MKELLRRIVSLLSLGVLASAPVLANELSCISPPKQKPPQDIRVNAGHYILTLVATDGHAQGRRATGSLELWPTSTSDRSSLTGERAYGDPKDQPLFGATDLDFDSVNAPVTMNPKDKEPLPTSRDPVFPGVLVLRRAPSDILLVSTLTNRRTKDQWQDGSGIVLKPMEKSDSEIRGVWDNWGIVAGSRGYFCIQPADSSRGESH